jgi:MFS family permease
VTAASYPAPANARTAVAVLAALGFFVSTDLALTALLIEPMKQELALTDVQIGLLQGTAFGLAFGLCSIPLGRMIDRANRVRMLIAGLIVWMLAMAATGLANGIAALILSRIALGGVAALLIPAAASIIADLYPPERRSVATSLFGVGQAVGTGFGILTGGLAYDALSRHGAIAGLTPWRLLYLGAAALGLVLLLALLILREPARQEKQEEARSGGQAARELWSHRAFLAPLLGAMLFSAIAIQAAQTWAAPVLIRAYALTPGQFAGWLGPVMIAGGILGALAGGQLGELGRRKGGRAGVLLPAMIAALIGAPLALFALAPSTPVFAAMLALNLMFGSAIAIIGIVAITLNIPNEIRGLAIGATVFTTAVFGVATGPAAIALVSGWLGGEAMLGGAIAAVAAPCSLLAALCFFLAMRGARER